MNMQCATKPGDFAVIPFNRKRIKDKYLVSNMFGGWDLLTDKELNSLHSFACEEDVPLFKRLYERRVIVDEKNLKNLLNDYRNLNSNLFCDTSLHIAVVTTRCNLQCRYCQARSKKAKDMSIEVAARVLKYIFDTKNRFITLEFQGGEPLLNWDTVKFLIEQAHRINTVGKTLKIALVSNFTLLDDAKISFLSDFGVEICGSLDGPKYVHDKNRVFANGTGSYDIVKRNLKALQEKLGRKVDVMPTITKYSLPYFKEIVDEYIALGQAGIALRPVNKLGSACDQWPDIGYAPEEFISFYRNAMDYILERNKQGFFIAERTAALMLEKILNRRDPGYIELMNPCGAGRSQIVYMPDGSCYPCDEARMAGDDMFKLGNITVDNYEDVMKKENLLHLLESSVMNLWDNGSAFSPWIATCPIVNYSQQNNFVPKIFCSSIHKIYTAQFEYIFEKIVENEENLEIFKRWVKKEVRHA